MKKAHYFPLESSGKELKIAASYQLGGVNCFSYKQESRGLFVHFTQVERETSSGGFICERTMMFANGNFKMLAMPLARKSQKKLELLGNYLEENAAKMAALYDAGERSELFALVQAFDPATLQPVALQQAA